MKKLKTNLTLKELRKRPKSYFKFINGIGVYYNRKTDKYIFDCEISNF